ncbi:TPA: hypothetical protein CPT85_08525 [Candidatus Gastranaerophilales bacterium HUM_21]|nr:MAG TPA: hypothetical protein CPT85_08525 [Candidatus Gastranaerophilales bacterium HUM_21]
MSWYTDLIESTIDAIKFPFASYYNIYLFNTQLLHILDFRAKQPENAGLLSTWLIKINPMVVEIR